MLNNAAETMQWFHFAPQLFEHQKGMMTTHSYGENKTTKFWGTLRWHSSKKDKKVATQPLHPFSFRTELKGTETKQGVRPHADQKERRKKEMSVQ